MPRSHAKTWTQTLARIQRLCCLGIGSEMLMPDLMREVTGLMSSQVGMFWWVRPELHTRECIQYAYVYVGTLSQEFHSTRRETELLRLNDEISLSPVSNPVLPFGHFLRVEPRTFSVAIYTILFGDQLNSAIASRCACVKPVDAMVCSSTARQEEGHSHSATSRRWSR